jgi:branched-chain amino acid transport system substrate-binding protein
MHLQHPWWGGLVAVVLSGLVGVTADATGRHFPLIQEILHDVYAQGKGPGPEGEVGTARWNLGVLDAVLVTEAIRTAMRQFGHQPLTGVQVQWDGTQWQAITDWMAPDQALVRPLVEVAAAKYAQEKGITPRDCP